MDDSPLRNRLAALFYGKEVPTRVPGVSGLARLRPILPPAAGLNRKDMTVKDELIEATAKIFRDVWTRREGQVVPQPEDLKLGNDAVLLDAAVLYADMNGSTRMVDSKSATFAAEVYKAYLACAARIIKSEGGAITAYDGDRIMAVFIGDLKNTNAAKTALKVNWAVSNIVNPTLKRQYGDTAFQMRHTIGVDTSTLLVSRIGVRNDNDLVWVGRAANYAAKLSELDNDAYSLNITGAVFDKLADTSKFGGEPRQIMWKEFSWTTMNKMRIHRSNWTWPL